MAQYNLSHTGQQLDAAVEKYLQTDFNSFIDSATLNNYVTNAALNTTLANYLPANTQSNTGVFLRGDNTWSNILNTSEAGITGDTSASIRLKVIHQTTGVQCGVSIAASGSNHGVWSNGYSDGTTFTDSASWLIFRNAQGETVVPNDLYTYNALITRGRLWVQAGSAAGSNANRLTTTSGMPGNMQYQAGNRGLQIYSNGIAIGDPYNGNNNSDAGWIRHIETTANDGELEIAVGDDGTEMMVARQYNTSNNIAHQLILMNSAGNMVTNQDIFILHATNATLSAFTTCPKIVFGEGSNASQSYVQGVAIAYTDYDSYRATKGLKVLDYDNTDNGNVWFEAQGQMYSKGFNNTSSREVKHNIHSFTEMGDILDRLEPVTFEYNDIPGQLRYGLIFEDTINILPTICEESGESKTINYVDLVPILLKEIQSLRKRVKKLENSIEKL